MLDLLPVAVAVLVGQTQKHDVGLFGEVLRLLDNIDEHLFDRVLVGGDFLLDQNRSLPLELVDGICTVELLLDVCVVG